MYVIYTCGIRLCTGKKTWNGFFFMFIYYDFWQYIQESPIMTCFRTKSILYLQNLFLSDSITDNYIYVLYCKLQVIYFIPMITGFSRISLLVQRVWDKQNKIKLRQTKENKIETKFPNTIMINSKLKLIARCH